MRSGRATKAVLIIMGVLAGAAAMQLLWPLMSAAQGGGPNFVMQATAPSHEQKVRVYKPVRPDLSGGKGQAISRAFGMAGTPTARAGDILGLDEGGKMLRIRGDSGAIMFLDTSRVGTPNQKALPSGGQGGSTADQFTRQNALLPPEAFRSSVEVVSLQRQTGPNAAVGNVPIEMQVNYGFKLHGKPVEGPGAKAMVILGAGGEVIGFNKAWREVVEDREVTTRTSAQAVAELRRKGGWNMVRQGGGVRTVRVTKARAGFWAEDIGRGQVEIEPAYIFEGTFERGDGVQVEFLQKVSAVADKAEPTVPSSPVQPPRQ
jgi:hypothetical protein